MTPAPDDPDRFVVTIHSLAQATGALCAAAGAQKPVVLLSAPDAGISTGAGWWPAMLGLAREAVPEAIWSALIDCGDDAGAAQAALRAEAGDIIFTGRSDVAERLADIAREREVRVIAVRPCPDIDLLPLFFADAETVRREVLARFTAL